MWVAEASDFYPQLSTTPSSARAILRFGPHDYKPFHQDYLISVVNVVENYYGTSEIISIRQPRVEVLT